MTARGRPAVFLDRDGVLLAAEVVEGVPRAPSRLAQARLLPGVSEASQMLHAAGFLLIVVTNQPDVARGRTSPAEVRAINDLLRAWLPIDDVRVCMHDDADECECRKPKDGMLRAAAKEWGIDLGCSYMVGDRWRDMEAGRRAGCTTVFIDHGYRERYESAPPDHVTASLEEALPMLMPNSRLASKATDELRVEIFADGADLASIQQLAENPMITGFTTNPTLMRKAGVTDYAAFARGLLATVRGRPISFEVFSDELAEMERQALRLASWGDEVYVKIPVTNTRGESTAPLVRRLAAQGVKVNVTAIFLPSQVEEMVAALAGGPPAFLSVFAGRIADAGLDPIPTMQRSLQIMSPQPHIRLIWASPREVLNIVQASRIGCHVVTVTPELLAKLSSLGKDLREFSLDTVRMFRDDALAAGYSL